MAKTGQARSIQVQLTYLQSAFLYLSVLCSQESERTDGRFGWCYSTTNGDVLVSSSDSSKSISGIALVAYTLIRTPRVCV